jgi:hypothetical protein
VETPSSRLPFAIANPGFNTMLVEGRLVWIDDHADAFGARRGNQRLTLLDIPLEAVVAACGRLLDRAGLATVRVA